VPNTFILEKYVSFDIFITIISYCIMLRTVVLNCLSANVTNSFNALDALDLFFRKGIHPIRVKLSMRVI